LANSPDPHDRQALAAGASAYHPALHGEQALDAVALA
jgi:hypothetical protein